MATLWANRESLLRWIYENADLKDSIYISIYYTMLYNTDMKNEFIADNIMFVTPSIALKNLENSQDIKVVRDDLHYRWLMYTKI